MPNSSSLPEWAYRDLENILLSACLKSKGTFGSLISFTGGFVFGVLLLAVGFFSWYKFKSNRQMFQAAASTAAFSKDRLHSIFSRSRGGLPPWLKSPDFCDPVFVNAAMKILWPRIDKAGAEWAFKDRALENLLNSQTFWKPRWLEASGVVLQSLVLGHVPPEVTDIQVYPAARGSSNSAIVADMSFSWNSKMEVKLAMKTLEDIGGLSIIDKLLSCLYSTISIKVVVRDLVARGQIRVTAAPLLDSIPVVGGFHISFLEPPAISYEVSSFGANPLMLPGLESWMNSFIAENVMTPFTYPEGFEINLGHLMGIDVPHVNLHPEGILTVTVKSASGVPRTDYFGTCDPYVKVFLKKSYSNSTSVKSNTLSPVWDEGFEFLVHDKAHQALYIQVWDSEVFRQDDLIGTAAIQLENLKLDCGTTHILVPLQILGKQKEKRQFEKMLSAKSVDSEAEEAAKKLFVQPEEIIYVSEPMALQRSKSLTTAVADAFNYKAITEAVKKKIGSKKLLVNMEINFLPFSSSEANEASRAAEGDGIQSQMSNLSARAIRFLNGGMLYVNLNRAMHLKQSKAITKKFRIRVAIESRGGEIYYEKFAERTGIGKGLNARDPVFDQSVDILVDGDVASDPQSVLRVDIFVVHIARKPGLRGSVTIELGKIIESGRIQDRWELQGSTTGGQIEMSLEWLRTLDSM